MIRRAFIKVLDALSGWLDRQIQKDMEKNWGPAPSSPGPKTARLPDGHFAVGERWVAMPLTEEQKKPFVIYGSVHLTPDRPAPTEYWRGKSVEEICAELEGR